MHNNMASIHLKFTQHHIDACTYSNTLNSSKHTHTPTLAWLLISYLIKQPRGYYTVDCQLKPCNPINWEGGGSSLALSKTLFVYTYFVKTSKLLTIPLQKNYDQNVSTKLCKLRYRSCHDTFAKSTQKSILYPVPGFSGTGLSVAAKRLMPYIL